MEKNYGKILEAVGRLLGKNLPHPKAVTVEKPKKERKRKKVIRDEWPDEDEKNKPDHTFHQFARKERPFMDTLIDWHTKQMAEMKAFRNEYDALIVDKVQYVRHIKDKILANPKMIRESFVGGVYARQMCGIDRLVKPDESKLQESIFPFINPDAGTAFDDRFYQSLAEVGVLDLPPQTIQVAQRLMMMLYRKNPWVYRTVELKKDFLIGDGVKFEAKDPRVQELLERHWDVNEWDRKLPERLRSLGIFGEQVYPIFIDEATGLIRLGSIVPIRIITVMHDGENPEDADVVRVTLSSGSLTGTGGIVTSVNLRDFQVVKRRDGPGNLSGECFYWSTNRVSGSLRGASDLITLVDWFELLDGLVFSAGERGQIALDIVYDILYEGLKPNEIQKKVKDFGNALKSGGIYGHNEKIKLQIMTPHLGSSEADQAGQLIMKQMQSGTGFNATYFGDLSAHISKAGGDQIEVPIAKMIEGAQAALQDNLGDVFDYQIQIAKDRGVLDGVTNFDYEIELPKMAQKHITDQTEAFAKLANTLLIAQQQGWLSRELATKTFQYGLEQLSPIVAQMQTPEEGQDGEQAPTSHSAIPTLATGEPEPSVKMNDVYARRGAKDLGKAKV